MPATLRQIGRTIRRQRRSTTVGLLPDLAHAQYAFVERGSLRISRIDDDEPPTLMHQAQEFLQTLTMVLCVAAVTTVVFQRLHQPVILGYLLAGMLIGPHIPVPLVADSHIVNALAELGVILLMFSLGIEFSLRKLRAWGPRPASWPSCNAA